MLPGFQHCFQELCNLIIDTAALVARACDRYALAKIEGYEPGYLERVVRMSRTTKARLLHYFRKSQLIKLISRWAMDTWTKMRQISIPGVQLIDEMKDETIDHGCLTGLTSAVYIDERANAPTLPSKCSSKSPPPLSVLPEAPDPNSGLYIRSRTGAITMVKIPTSCLAFQTGETLELITGGKFQAVPHFVRAGRGASVDGVQVARNTLAVFTQPGIYFPLPSSIRSLSRVSSPLSEICIVFALTEAIGLDEIVDRTTGKTYAQFSREVAERFK
ncbi:MAG: hypothetical protein Q9182_006823 [Xanthomendoza sp. 2 TL-2023]